MPPRIPLFITVHLGPPDSPAENVTVPYIDYIKNVASSEIYPTWPENAIRANIYAQMSFALNRIYTEYYRSRGYPFDITNSTTMDQAFIYGRDVFTNINDIVDTIFDSYIRREGNAEPLFAQYCDGIQVTCNGLSQWGSVDLANEGLSPYEILQYYYGNDIIIERNVPIVGIRESVPSRPLVLGNVEEYVRQIQLRLNRISQDYPMIPKISPVDGIFGIETLNAVLTFQKIFNLIEDGVVGPQTWYKILTIYYSVKRISDLASEGLNFEDITPIFPAYFKKGDNHEYVEWLRYYLSFISQFLEEIPTISIDTVFDQETEDALIAFQKLYGLTPDGLLGPVTWNVLESVYRDFYNSLPAENLSELARPYPGTVLKLGMSSDSVRYLQQYLNYVSDTYPEIPKVEENGVFDLQTQRAVEAYQKMMGIGESGIVSCTTWYNLTELYNNLKSSER